MIIHGNNIEILKTFEDNFFDAVVTDPPYGLAFMSKKWDYDVPSVELWREVLRVLKPGGHMLAFGGTRTYHRMVVNIEDAGFEIRDRICYFNGVHEVETYYPEAWIYGQGFPKSQDISKKIDEKLGAKREVVGYKKLNERDTKVYTPNVKTSFVSDSAGINDKGLTGQEITEPVTDEAKQWQGWGTGLKPSNEPIVLARKPISENTIAENVLKHGTGGINIEASRIGVNGGCKREEGTGGFDAGTVNAMGGHLNSCRSPQSEGLGRFPANLVFSCDCEGPHEPGCPVGELDRQSGVLKSGAMNTVSKGFGNSKIFGNEKGNGKQIELKQNASSGFASRFFYVAKSSKAERNKGLSKDQQNGHPTVKPVELCRYLCRLITPPKGKILDPFNGSGSTGVAAGLEWFEYYGIEQEEDHVKISKARQPPPDLFT